MKYQSYIEELQNFLYTIEEHHIVWWLNKYKNEFYITCQNTNCGKWQKYINNNEMPYPCCCQIKDKDCIFLELYYNLESLVKEDEPDIFFIKNIIKRALNNY